MDLGDVYRSAMVVYRAVDCYVDCLVVLLVVDFGMVCCAGRDLSYFVPTEHPLVFYMYGVCLAGWCSVDVFHLH